MSNVFQTIKIINVLIKNTWSILHNSHLTGHSRRGYAVFAAVIVGVSQSWWAWLSGFVIGLPPHASVCAEWVLNAYNSHQQLWAEEQRGLFHHGTHQRPELPQTGAMVQIQRRKPQHEADVRRRSGQIQQVQVKHIKRASAARVSSVTHLHWRFISSSSPASHLPRISCF